MLINQNRMVYNVTFNRNKKILNRPHNYHQNRSNKFLFWNTHDANYLNPLFFLQRVCLQFSKVIKFHLTDHVVISHRRRLFWRAPTCSLPENLRANDLRIFGFFAILNETTRCNPANL